jgi:hypothetical protein
VDSILGQIGTKIGEELKALAVSSPTDEYKQLVYGADGALAYVQVYSDQGLSNLISSKAFTYTSGALSQIKSYALGQLVFTQSMTYDSSGKLESIEKDYA